ncbi:MAG: hypothetical protein LBI27_06860 [Clostridiales bacterium]|jgi:hypothetical protein|nr:hypothetical protein [Clostridiales bacterium]
MSKNKAPLTEGTIIVFKDIPVGEYRKYFLRVIGNEILGKTGMDFQNWLMTQAGKTLKEATDEYFRPLGHEKMEEFLTERRFNNVSDLNKEFIIYFDKSIGELGYDFGGVFNWGHSWGSKITIIYGKTGTKSRQCPARIHIRDNDILFQMYFTKIDSHRQYIESAPPYIKKVFTDFNDGKGCTFCRSKCGPKEFTIDGDFKSICRDAPFWFDNPTEQKLPDYMGLLAEFYPMKKAK